MSHDESTPHPLEALSAYVDGELAGDELGAVERHLRGCAACRDLAQDLRAIDRAAVADTPPAVPADLAGRIRARLDAAAAPGIPAAQPAPPPAVERHRPSRTFWRQAMPLAAAASLLIAIFIWRSRPEQPPSRADQAPPLVAESSVPRENMAVPPPPPPPTAASAPPAVPPTAIGGSSAQAKKESKPQRFQEKRKAIDDQVAGNLPEATGGESESMRSLRSLGYLETKQAARVEADAARDAAAPASAAAPAPVTAAPPAAELAPATGVAQEVDGFATAGGPVAPSLLRHRVAPPQIRAEPYLIRLLEDRLVTIESGSYACFVQVSEQDASQIATLIKEAANAAKVTVAPPTTKEQGFGAAIPSASPEARRVLLSMIRERYRPALEARCGPLPR